MAIKDLFEGSELTLKGKVKRGRSRTIKFHLDFNVEVDGKNEDEIEKTGSAIFDPVISTKYTLPDVPDDQEFYMVTWGADAEGIKGRKWSPDVIRVWPRSMTLEAVDDQDAKVEGFPFQFRQVLEPVEVRATDAEGISTFDLTEPRPVLQIIPIAPWEIMEGPTQNGRKWEATVRKKPYTATFYSPDFKKEWRDEEKEDGPVKQYVNLSGADANQGNVIKFKIGPKDTDDKKDQSLGMLGDSFYIQFIPDDKNSKRDTPKPNLRTTGTMSKDGNTFKSKVELSEDGGLVEFAVDLGFAGGDKFELKIGVTEECGDDSIKFINWRRIHYHVTRPTALAVPDMSDAKNGFKDVFIDFESFDVPNAVFNKDAVGMPAGAWVKGNIIESGAPTDVLVVGEHNVTYFKNKFDKKKTPAAHIILCHYQLDAEDDGTPYVYEANSIPIDDTDKLKWPPGSDTEVRGWSMPGSQTGNDDALYFSKDLRDGTDAVKSCRWKESGGAWQNIPGDHIVIDQANNGNNVHIKLPDDAVDVIDNGDDITLSIKVAYAVGWYNGWCAAGGHNVIKAGRPASGINGTIVHEIGHAINQAAKDKTLFPGLDEPPHARYYTNNRGHQGSHCADGIDKATYDDKTKKLNTVDAQDKCTCIMYGAGSDKRNENIGFCDNCKPYVHAVKIEEVTTA